MKPCCNSSGRMEGVAKQPNACRVLQPCISGIEPLSNNLAVVRLRRLCGCESQGAPSLQRMSTWLFALLLLLRGALTNADNVRRRQMVFFQFSTENAPCPTEATSSSTTLADLTGAFLERRLSTAKSDCAARV